MGEAVLPADRVAGRPPHVHERVIGLTDEDIAEPAGAICLVLGIAFPHAARAAGSFGPPILGLFWTPVPYEPCEGDSVRLRFDLCECAVELLGVGHEVEGPIVMTSCIDNERHDCALESCCQVRPHMNVVNGIVRGALAGLSLSSLSEVKA